MPRKDDLPPLSETQMEIMRVVWDRGEVTVPEVWAALPRGRSVARNTVQTLVARLEEKGWLGHREPGPGQGTAFRYFARVPRAATLRGVVGRLLDAAFGGSAEALVMALLDERGLTKGEADRIRQMIERAEAVRPRPAPAAKRVPGPERRTP